MHFTTHAGFCLGLVVNLVVWVSVALLLLPDIGVAGADAKAMARTYDYEVRQLHLLLL